ncbi:hypothetical protein HK102_002380 [Quaeritorhiza haematococci]|nr:hypothetical protein HK102_002380 [Quaeritorhiza haematococci]
MIESRESVRRQRLDEFVEKLRGDDTLLREARATVEKTRSDSLRSWREDARRKEEDLETRRKEGERRRMERVLMSNGVGGGGGRSFYSARSSATNTAATSLTSSPASSSCSYYSPYSRGSTPNTVVSGYSSTFTERLSLSPTMEDSSNLEKALKGGTTTNPPILQARSSTPLRSDPKPLDVLSPSVATSIAAAAEPWPHSRSSVSTSSLSKTSSAMTSAHTISTMAAGSSSSDLNQPTKLLGLGLEGLSLSTKLESSLSSLQSPPEIPPSQQAKMDLENFLEHRRRSRQERQKQMAERRERELQKLKSISDGWESRNKHHEEEKDEKEDKDSKGKGRDNLKKDDEDTGKDKIDGKKLLDDDELGGNKDSDKRTCVLSNPPRGTGSEDYSGTGSSYGLGGNKSESSVGKYSSTSTPSTSVTTSQPQQNPVPTSVSAAISHASLHHAPIPPSAIAFSPTATTSSSFDAFSASPPPYDTLVSHPHQHHPGNAGPTVAMAAMPAGPIFLPPPFTFRVQVSYHPETFIPQIVVTMEGIKGETSIMFDTAKASAGLAAAAAASTKSSEIFLSDPVSIKAQSLEHLGEDEYAMQKDEFAGADVDDGGALEAAPAAPPHTPVADGVVAFSAEKVESEVIARSQHQQISIELEEEERPTPTTTFVPVSSSDDSTECQESSEKPTMIKILRRRYSKVWQGMSGVTFETEMEDEVGDPLESADDLAAMEDVVEGGGISITEKEDAAQKNDASDVVSIEDEQPVQLSNDDEGLTEKEEEVPAITDTASPPAPTVPISIPVVTYKYASTWPNAHSASGSPNGSKPGTPPPEITFLDDLLESAIDPAPIETSDNMGTVVFADGLKSNALATLLRRLNSSQQENDANVHLRVAEKRRNARRHSDIGVMGRRQPIHEIPKAFWEIKKEEEGIDFCEGVTDKGEDVGACEVNMMRGEEQLGVGVRDAEVDSKKENDSNSRSSEDDEDSEDFDIDLDMDDDQTPRATLLMAMRKKAHVFAAATSSLADEPKTSEVVQGEEEQMIHQELDQKNGIEEEEANELYHEEQTILASALEMTASLIATSTNPTHEVLTMAGNHNQGFDDTNTIASVQSGATYVTARSSPAPSLSSPIAAPAGREGSVSSKRKRRNWVSWDLGSFWKISTKKKQKKDHSTTNNGDVELSVCSASADESGDGHTPPGSPRFDLPITLL